jgi:phage tail sheath gpL-like
LTAILKPETNFNIISAKQIAETQEQKVLLVGQKESGQGVVPDWKLIKDFPNDADIDYLFGNSSLANMVHAFKEINQTTRLDIIPAPDDTGASLALGSFGFLGTATIDCSIKIKLQSSPKYDLTLNVKKGETSAEIALNLLDIIPDVFYASYSSSVYDVVSLKRFVSSKADNFFTSYDGYIPGVEILNTGLGKGDGTLPSLSNIFDEIGDTRYQTIIWPEVYPLDVVKNLLNSRFNADNQILDGVVFQTKVDTLANIKTYALEQNSQNIVVIGLNRSGTVGLLPLRIKGISVPETPNVITSRVAAIRALRFTKDSNISNYLSTSSSRDQLGGIAIRSLPYFNTLLPNTGVPYEHTYWSNEDLEELANNGISTVGPNRDYNAVVFGEFVTTNTDEKSYKYLNHIDTVSIVREYFYENCRKRYSQTRLTDGDLEAGRDLAKKVL